MNYPSLQAVISPSPEKINKTSAGDNGSVVEEETLEFSKQFPELTARVTNTQIGPSLPCFVNAACSPQLDKVARATVLLLLVGEIGGRFCTGTLIYGPSPDEVLILTANHCR